MTLIEQFIIARTRYIETSQALRKELNTVRLGQGARRLSIIQVLVLSAINASKMPLMAKDIAAALNSDAGAISRSISALIKGEYILIQPHHLDHRAQSYSLTPKGDDVLEDCKEVITPDEVRRLILEVLNEK